MARRLLGRVVGWLLASRPAGRITTADLAKAEFRTSTQRLGARFTDRVRDVFRFKWVKRHVT